MKRTQYEELIAGKLKRFSVVALLGARQVGKTTLARNYCEKIKDFNWKTHYFDLEDPTALARLDDPKLALQNLEGLVVIDEIQRRPELFTVLRYLVDRKENKLKLLILGSASIQLIQQSAESLAGRIAYIEINPFSINEVKAENQDKLWLKGGYPKAFLANNEIECFEWLAEYVRTYLERDIPQLGINIPAVTLQRFWKMLTHVHGNLLNSSELARSFGVADTTIKRYLDILSGTFMTRQLQPYFSNTKKRLVKSPKIYFRDTGLLHYLLGIRGKEDLETNLKLGASWEGFALEQVISIKKAHSNNCFFWAIHNQGEIDLLIEKGNKLEAFEFKYSANPSISKSMKLALKELPIDKITIVSPVESSFMLSKEILVSPLSEVLQI